MEIKTQLYSSLSQVAAVLIFSLFYFSIHWAFILRKKSEQTSFFKYIGIQSCKNQFDKKYFFILFLISVIAVVTTFLEFQYSVEFKQMLMSENSPYGKILKNGFGIHAVLLGLIYCFVMASASEEILFRGLIAKRLFASLGHKKGNILQALIFWLMHLLIFRLLTNEWFSFLQVIGFLTSFGMGSILGYVNFRRVETSIVPSWLMHGCANFVTFLTMAFLYPS